MSEFKLVNFYVCPCATNNVIATFNVEMGVVTVNQMILLRDRVDPEKVIVSTSKVVPSKMKSVNFEDAAFGRLRALVCQTYADLTGETVRCGTIYSPLDARAAA